MDPERFKAMIEANGGKMPEQMAERMRQMGMDPDDVLKQMGITPGEGTPAPSAPAAPSTPITVDAVFVRDEKYMAERAKVDFTQYAKANELEDGEAKQQLRQFEDKILVAQQDKRLAETSLEGKVRLAERDFITANELDLEKVKVEKARINLESSETDLNLYVHYTFVKTAEMLLSDYEEALSSLERTMQEASAKLAQADAGLKSAEQRYNLEKSQLEDLKDQLAKCVIRAERPGLVVYGSSTENNPFRRSNEEPILEGTTVRERQKIITIPDMTKMGVKVSIHESAVQRIALGQTARLRVDAFADRPLTGTVDRVAVLADSANMFMNPDLKVYPTTVRIDGVYDWLRPGMSAVV
jgi:HlyD family secretion protein